jgi:hypothetical protein
MATVQRFNTSELREIFRKTKEESSALVRLGYYMRFPQAFTTRPPTFCFATPSNQRRQRTLHKKSLVKFLVKKILLMRKLMKLNFGSAYEFLEK